MIETIPVEVRFEPDGTLIPLAFEWQEKRYQIESHGRQWEEDGARHFLVMVFGDLVFELGYVHLTNRWYLLRAPNDFRPKTRV